jgi:hypothetical protein
MAHRALKAHVFPGNVSPGRERPQRKSRLCVSHLGVRERVIVKGLIALIALFYLTNTRPPWGTNE